MAKVTCVVDCRNKLGEVPVWDVAEQALYWVDIEGRLLQRLTPATGRVDRWEMPERIACFALRETGGLIVAFASGIAFYDLDSGAIDWIARRTCSSQWCTKWSLQNAALCRRTSMTAGPLHTRHFMPAPLRPR